jgi:2-C-methyl-D-erythritol 4-phosphate cytidylyltransferase
MGTPVGAVWGIVVAAGSGSRFGRVKQYEDLGGRAVLAWSLDAAWSVCDGVVAVLPAGGATSGWHASACVVGGATRSDSVRAGLAEVPDAASIVVVHDAARPLATASLFARVVEAVRAGADAAVPAVVVSDTIKRVDGAIVAETLDRSVLVGVQTPQAFRAAVLREAHASGREATDDAALVEAIGGKVVVVQGERRNVKLTTRDDLLVARAFLGADW